VAGGALLFSQDFEGGTVPGCDNRGGSRGGEGVHQGAAKQARPAELNDNLAGERK
jgi:hypothetical protein